MEINVMSAFNGMGCIWLALDKLKIKVNKRYSSETDKYANQVNDKNYSNTIQLGDIKDVKGFDLEIIDLFVGGSPCQGFSYAGKQLAFDDPRSKLFFEYIRLLNEVRVINPNVKFLLENVDMSKNELRIISEYLGVFPVLINSNLLSAQNRKRWYWTNIRTKEVGLFSEKYTDIPQPEDKGILLKDILQPEIEVDSKYYLKEKNITRGFEQAKGKTWKSGNRMGQMEFPNYVHKKAKTLTTFQTEGGREINHILTGIDINGKSPTQRSSTGNCTDDKHNYQIIKLDKSLNKKANQDKADFLTGGGNSGGNHSDMDIINISNGYRRLTPIECERLQTVPDNYTDCISDTQRYKMLGNGWTVDVIAHILSNLTLNKH